MYSTKLSAEDQSRVDAANARLTDAYDALLAIPTEGSGAELALADAIAQREKVRNRLQAVRNQKYLDSLSRWERWRHRVREANWTAIVTSLLGGFFVGRFTYMAGSDDLRREFPFIVSVVAAAWTMRAIYKVHADLANR